MSSLHAASSPITSSSSSAEQDKLPSLPSSPAPATPLSDVQPAEAVHDTHHAVTRTEMQDHQGKLPSLPSPAPATPSSDVQPAEAVHDTHHAVPHIEMQGHQAGHGSHMPYVAIDEQIAASVNRFATLDNLGILNLPMNEDATTDLLDASLDPSLSSWVGGLSEEELNLLLNFDLTWQYPENAAVPTSTWPASIDTSIGPVGTSAFQMAGEDYYAPNATYEINALTPLPMDKPAGTVRQPLLVSQVNETTSTNLIEQRQTQVVAENVSQPTEDLTHPVDESTGKVSK